MTPGGTFQETNPNNSLNGEFNAGAELIILKTFVGDNVTGHLPLRINHIGPTGTLWATDNTNGVWKSTDDAVTWTKTATVAGMAGVKYVLELANGNVLIVAFDATPVYHIMQSTDGGATFTSKLNFPSASLGILGSQSWVQDSSGNIYAAEYGPTNQPTISLYKSTNNGGTWTAIYQFAQGVVRHFHAVRVDPYVTGRIWVTIGDTGTQPRIGYSDDGGVSFQWITQGNYPESRAIGLIFTSDAVYWASDTPDVTADVYRYDRNNKHISTVTGRKFATPFYWAVQFGNLMAFLGGAETAGNGYTGEGFDTWLTGNNGNFFSEVARWKITQTSTITPSTPYGITEPDANGMFWVCYQALDGLQGITNSSESTVINFKLQLISKVLTDEPRQDLRRMVLGGGNKLVEFASQPYASFSATTQQVVYIAPEDCILIGAQFSVFVTLASDASNYWTGSIRHFRAGAIQSGDPGGGILVQVGGASQAWPANDVMSGGLVSNCPWIIKAGDVLVVRYEKTLTPSNIQDPCVTLRLIRLQSILS